MAFNDKTYYNLDWKLDQQYQQKAMSMSSPKVLLESEIFYGMWCLVMCHTTIANSSCRVRLCSLPTDVDEIKVLIHLYWFTEEENGVIKLPRQTLNYENSQAKVRFPRNTVSRNYTRIKVAIDVEK
eukprot:960091_1